MKKLALLLNLLLVLVVACSTSTSGNGRATKSASPAHSKSVTATPGASQNPQAKGTQPPIQNGDWRLDSITLKDSLGDFGGRARITYTGSDQNGGTNLFTITVFKNGRDIASLDGSANTVLPGHTVTADLISSDRYVSGPYTFDFQNNL